ncbi:aminopeptidase N [Oryzias latipes]|uniref:Aminopeptidase n=1 Tax=Oryzias latipes TaxID=8090 RepID=A0A3B3IM79_ORYLA|nr:aminopeptidase N [Oryzias latipes]
MAKRSSLSKGLAVAFVVLTVSAIGGMVAMVTLFKIQMNGINATALPDTTTPSPTPPPIMRLPKTLVPELYEISLHTDFYSRIIEEVNVTSPNQSTLFTGNVTIHFHTVQSTDLIYLHCKDLDVSHHPSRLLNKEYNIGIKIKSMTQYQNQSEFLVIQLEEKLQAKMNYSLFLSFKGQMSTYLESLFVSTYTEAYPSRDFEEYSDTLRYAAATHLKPTQARTLFPCFDEPQMKAVFKLTLFHRVGTFAQGNAEMEGSDIMSEEWKQTRFVSTEKMSTYLFGFTVSEFKATDSPKGRVSIKTYTRPEAKEAGHAIYAANITRTILLFYEDRFEINYQPLKIDQIALPDLVTTGMENWGLITYQEASVLYQEGVSSLLHKEKVATVIAHELAHHWFGNLVTMSWWNDVWLNEGFATYSSYFAVDHVEPDFKIKDILIMRDLHEALKEDALITSRPLAVLPDDVQTPSEIKEMFDTVSYSKGAMLLRMLADFVGETAFNQGVKTYLKAFRGATTETTDLWQHIESARLVKNTFTVSKVMKTWTEKQGYPVININTTNGEIFQKQFLFNGSITSSHWWYIPIWFMKGSLETAFLWLAVPGPVKKEEFISGKDWILANVDCLGFYRVNYNLENWQRLLWQLEYKPDRIPVINRGQLIDDALNLARANLLDVTVALNFTFFLRNEREFIPWDSAVKNMEYFFLMFDRSQVYGLMQEYLRSQVTGLYEFFANETNASDVPKTHSLQHSQILAIKVACSNGLPECLEMVESKFGDWMNNGTNKIHVNLRSTIYCQAMAAGGQAEWDFAWEKFQSSTDSSERDQLRHALSCTRQTWLLNRLLEYSLNPDKIRLTDVASVVNDVAENPAGQALAWNFIRAHWDYVSQGDPVWLIEAVTRRFSTKFEVEELQRFAEQYDLGPTVRAVHKAIEQTQVNMNWVNKNKDRVLQWFKVITAHLDDK